MRALLFFDPLVKKQNSKQNWKVLVFRRSALSPASFSSLVFHSDQRDGGQKKHIAAALFLILNRAIAILNLKLSGAHCCHLQSLISSDP